jgi:hypothetical protein
MQDSSNLQSIEPDIIRNKNIQGNARDMTGPKWSNDHMSIGLLFIKYDWLEILKDCLLGNAKDVMSITRLRPGYRFLSALPKFPAPQGKITNLDF